MTYSDLGSWWLIAAVLVAVVGASVTFLLRERGVRRRRAVLDFYARQQLALYALEHPVNPARGGRVLPGRRAE
jgi:hypothetical protein